MARHNDIGKLRRSQVITTYGPGAIIDFRSGTGGAAVSAVAAGLDQWDEASQVPGLEHPQTIFEPRLQKRLNVEGFRLPPVIPERAPGRPALNGDKLVGRRFPTWLQCPRCDVIKPAHRWGNKPGDPSRWCAPCSRKTAGDRNRVYVFPVRFIAVCERGHLSDFPWDRWVGHRDSCGKNKRELKLSSEGRAGLAGLLLRCTACSAGRSMEDVFRADALRTHCKGERPWLAKADESCDKMLRGSQRGASNLYFPLLVSALDIPPWSHPIQKVLAPRWEQISAAPPEERTIIIRGVLREKRFARLLEHYSEQEILDQISEAIRASSEDTGFDLRHAEYVQFTRGGVEGGAGSREFEIRCEEVPDRITPWIDRIVRATRLREVRSIRGFTRIHPPSGADPAQIENLQPLSVRRKDWLPAIEVRGEGIFIELSGERLSAWERSEGVRERIRKLHETYQVDWARRHPGVEPPRIITPRLVLVHSLAHAIMRELALSCGYSSASLRERLYVSGDKEPPMAGILVYTASADSDGTLGGLTRQGERDRLHEILLTALESQQWCSSDPLCLTSVQSHSESLNLAACHACLMLPETSCEEFNRILDRGVLVGIPDSPEIGYFHDLLHQVPTP